MFCRFCGKTIPDDSTFCSYCGNTLGYNYSQSEYSPPRYTSSACAPFDDTSNKSKIAAGLLAIFLGGFGVHKFYLGRPGLGVLYLLFCWTSIPTLVGFAEGFIYLTSSDVDFYYKYVKIN